MNLFPGFIVFIGMIASNLDIQDLLTRCQAGDELAWETFIRHFQGRIYRVAWFYSGNKDDARDIAQDVFIKIYRTLKTCRDPSLLLPWMLKIARNAGIDFLRKRSRRPVETFATVEEFAHLKSDVPDPDEALEAGYRQNLVHSAIQAIDFNSREIILLKEIQGLKIEEIALVLGIPAGTVKSRSNKARIELTEAVLSLSGERGLR